MKRIILAASLGLLCQPVFAIESKYAELTGGVEALFSECGPTSELVMGYDKLVERTYKMNKIQKRMSERFGRDTFVASFKELEAVDDNPCETFNNLFIESLEHIEKWN